MTEKESWRFFGGGRTAVVLAVLLAGLGLRLALLSQTGDLTLRIADEFQYAELASSIAAGRGFAWEDGQLTSLRPPLFPAMVAGIWQVAGGQSLQAIRASQIVLALVTALLVFDLGRRSFNPKAGLIAAAICWLYPTLIFLNFTILTETLFTLLLVAFVWLAVMLMQNPRPATAAACGLALGLGALTRSVLWPLPLLLCPLLLLMLPGAWSRRALLVGLFVAGYGIVVTPWAVRNTSLQGVFTVVDTMGGLNLRMGNYEHTPDDRMWDAVSLRGEKNWVYAFTQEPHPTPVTEGMKDKWAQRKALEYMMAHPGTTLRRSAIKFADFWGLERSFIAGVQQGLYEPPTWFAYAASAAILFSYAGIALFGAAGAWLARPDWRVHLLVLLPVVVITGAHALAFGHSRYHVPLVPFLAVYAAGLLHTGDWRTWRSRRGATAGAALTVLVLIAIWLRQLLFVDAGRLGALLDAIGF